MHISEFLDLSLLEQIMEDWSKVTGLAAVAVDNEGNNITKEIGIAHGSAEDLADFSIDLTVGSNHLGKIVGGQTDEAKETSPKSDESIRTAAKLLDTMTNLLIDIEYKKSSDSAVIDSLGDNISQAAELIEEINAKTQALDKIESKQKILSLNASIEAARAGEFGRGFAVVATEFGKLAVNSGEINKSVKTSLKSLTTVIDELERSALN